MHSIQVLNVYYTISSLVLRPSHPRIVTYHRQQSQGGTGGTRGTCLPPSLIKFCPLVPPPPPPPHLQTIWCGDLFDPFRTTPHEEKGSGYNMTSHSTQSLNHLVCEMTNHSTVRVISSAVWSHVALIVYHIWHMEARGRLQWYLVTPL